MNYRVAMVFWKDATNHFVDYITSLNTLEEAIRYIEKNKSLFTKQAIKWKDTDETAVDMWVEEWEQDDFIADVYSVALWEEAV